MREQSGTFEGVGHIQLYQTSWIPEGEPKGVMVIVHGAGEHVHRYQNMVESLVPAGYLLTGYDHRGHGRSEGQRGHINSWDEYREDLHSFMDMARELAGGLPVFLYGHSLGSLIVLDYLLYYPDGLAGAIVSGNSVEPLDAAPPALVALAKVMTRVMPKFSMKVALNGDSLSRDPAVAKAYMDDPLVHWNRSARWGTECLQVVDWIKGHASEVRLPVLFVHGELDPLVSAAGAELFYTQVQSADKSMQVYREGLHEPHNDVCHPQVFADIQAWMDCHL